MVPTLVQGAVAGNDNGVQTTAPTLTVTLPNPAGANNCIAICLTFANTNTRALAATPVTDNKGTNTWVQAQAPFGAGTVMASYYALGVAAGTQVINIAFTGTATVNDAFWCSVTEWAGVQTSGVVRGSGTVSNGYFGSPITVTYSTPPSAGDLVLHWGTRDVNQNLNTYTSITPDTNFNLISSQLTVGAALQASNSTTASTCTLTPAGNTGDSWNSFAIVFKGSPASGTLPTGTGIRVIRTQTEVFNNTNVAPAMQFPCSGNLIVGLLNSEDVTISAASDDGSSVWNTGVVNNPNPGVVGVTQVLWAAQANTGPSRKITITYSGGTSSSVSCIKFLDVANAASSPFDVSSVSNGNQTTHGNLTSNTITPSQPNELVVNTTVVTWHTMTGLATDANGHTPTFLQQYTNKLDNANTGGTNESLLDEDDGRAFLYNTDTLPITFIYTNSATGASTPDGVAQWGATSVAFKAASAFDAFTLSGNYKLK